MNVAQRIIVICEGDSEVAYLRQLQRFLDSETDRRPLAFFPEKAGSGGFQSTRKTAQRIRKWLRRKKKKPRCATWVDYDLYDRNEGGSMTAYRLSRVKTLYFSFHNFEDFLVLHYPEDTIRQWKDIFEPMRHFEKPLHSDKYLPHFKRLFPDYKKGAVPYSMISWTSLRRLKANLESHAIPFSHDSDCRDFASFLITALATAFPDRLAPVPAPRPTPCDDPGIYGC